MKHVFYKNSERKEMPGGLIEKVLEDLLDTGWQDKPLLRRPGRKGGWKHDGDTPRNAREMDHRRTSLYPV